MQSPLLVACVALSFVAVSASGALIAVAQSPPQAATATPRNVDDWLLNAPDDQTRFKLLQDQHRGFSASMHEVGQRFSSLYDALGDKNYDLAAYQWAKVKDAIVTGYARRPKRQPNADAILVQKIYEPVLADLKSGDAARAWSGFGQARTACVSCHEAERLGFMNNQPLFRRTEKPKE
jgi:hypothetical protein